MAQNSNARAYRGNSTTRLLSDSAVNWDQDMDGEILWQSRVSFSPTFSPGGRGRKGLLLLLLLKLGKDRKKLHRLRIHPHRQTFQEADEVRD